MCPTTDSAVKDNPLANGHRDDLPGRKISNQNKERAMKVLRAKAFELEQENAKKNRSMPGGSRLVLGSRRKNQNIQLPTMPSNSTTASD